MSRFKPGQSGNPAGRPRKGMASAETLRASLAERADDVVQTVLNAALAGDLQAARLVLERILPPLKAHAVPADLPSLAGPNTLTAKADAVLDAIAAGTLAPDVGATLITAVAGAARVAEISELADRLEAIERALSARKESPK